LDPEVHVAIGDAVYVLVRYNAAGHMVVGAYDSIFAARSSDEAAALDWAHEDKTNQWSAYSEVEGEFLSITRHQIQGAVQPYDPEREPF
jgi:hypothetical protein